MTLFEKKPVKWFCEKCKTWVLFNEPHFCIKEREEMNPKEKVKQIENGENWIVEFWKVRGYEIVKTALGISFTLHKKPRYECLGLDLTYLEQFAKEAAKKQAENIFRDLRFADVKYNSSYDFIEIPLKVFKGLEKKYGG